MKRASPCARASTSASSAPPGPLDQVDVIDAHALERAVQLVARPRGRALPRLGRQEEPAAVGAQPRREAQLRVAVHRRRVDVVDAVLEQQLEHLVGARLLHAAERRGAEHDAGAPVAGPAEGDPLDHAATDSENVRAWRSGLSKHVCSTRWLLLPWA
jgi:hypothetical protein